MKRRDFLKVGGCGVASVLASGGYGVRGIADEMQSRPLRVGLIGAGWYGKVDLFRLIQVAPVEVVALCDVNRPKLDAAAELVAERQRSQKRPLCYDDYRTMLDGHAFDAVLIATPDHWHALPAIHAMKNGSDVYLQKPISVDVAEAQAIVAAAKKYGRVTQVGLQRRSTPHLVETKERFFDSGEIGQVGQVEIYTYGGEGDIFPEATSPPDGFDYDLWTGPAPMRPFLPRVVDRGWRAFMEYGNGTLGDMGVHMFDTARWMLRLGWPRHISGTGGRYIYNKGVQNIPDTQTVVFDYETLQIVWNHRHWSGTIDARHPWGAWFYGTNGLLKTSIYGSDFFPRGKNEPSYRVDVGYELDEYPEDKIEPNLEHHCAPAVRAHMKNFVTKMADRQPTVCDMTEGGISSICCILGNLSTQLGRSLEWDAQAGSVKNDPEANRLFARDYRSGWIHPSLVD